MTEEKKPFWKAPVVRAIVHCTHCGEQHIDGGKWAKFNHKKHLCRICGKFFEVPEPNIGVKELEPPGAQP